MTEKPMTGIPLLIWQLKQLDPNEVYATGHYVNGERCCPITRAAINDGVPWETLRRLDRAGGNVAVQVFLSDYFYIEESDLSQAAGTYDKAGRTESVIAFLEAGEVA